MSRIALPAVLIALAFPAVQALQVQTHGISASVTSPSPNGQSHGVPSSITSPTPVTGARTFGDSNSRVIFGSPRARHRRSEIVAVPVFYPVYVDTGNPPVQPVAEGDAAESEAASASETDALREAYNRGAQDALTELRARQRDRVAELQEKPRSKPAPRDEKKASSHDDTETGAETMARAPEPPSAPPGPPTTFIFKDGRRLETQNYAIVGPTLYDFSVKGLHKIRLTEIDLDATRRINDDNGTPIALP